LVPNRDLGAEFHGDVLDGAVSYGLGIFSGGYDYNGTTANSPSQDDKAFEGRVFFQPLKNTGIYPLKGLGFGLAGTYLANHPQTNSTTGLTPGYTTDGQQKFFSYSSGVNADGPGWRLLLLRPSGSSRRIRHFRSTGCFHHQIRGPLEHGLGINWKLGAHR
jgi:phosphate-selective porin OprO/OprP